MKRIHSAIGIGGAVAASSTLMPLSGDGFSLYFHVPFCTKKCDYCHFYVIPDQVRYKELYMRALKKEWQLRQPLLPNSAPISIYFGGGTPTLLGPHAIQEILSWVNPPSSCEVTLEANPENISLELMKQFAACGVNRVSLGVQSFDDTSLQMLSRTHTAACSLLAIESIYRAGIHNLSIDLMYDLPGQTRRSWEQTCKQAISVPITHLSLYNLTVEPHTVFFKKRDTLSLPDPQVSLDMLELAVNVFENADLKRYEISAFARDHQISKHNIGYWTQRPFLGLGPSAFSFWQESRFRNMANLNRYAKALDAGHEIIDFKETLDSKERTKESLALALRLIEGTSLHLWPSEIEQGVAPLIAEGLLEKKGDKLRLTSKGLLFHDTVAEHIMGL